VAQNVGYELDLDDEESCQAHACANHKDEFMGRWQDTRHDGVILAYVEHDILPHLQELLREVNQPTALRRLLDLGFVERASGDAEAFILSPAAPEL
jgi:peptidyl-tRNA hydrolase